MAEFLHHLTTHATGRTPVKFRSSFRASHNCNRCEAAFTLTDCLKKGSAFRTVCRCIGRIFNIAATVNPAFFSQQSRPHLKMRIGCIGHFPCCKCFLDECFYPLIIHSSHPPESRYGWLPPLSGLLPLYHGPVHWTGLFSPAPD